MHAVVIPFRGPASAKTRLAEGLSDAARRQLARAMYQHVLNVSCSTVGPRNVLVVTGSRTAAAIARRTGAVVLRERVAGHNEAVTEAIDHLRSRRLTTASVIAADLPLLKQVNVWSLVRCAQTGQLGIAPDRSGGGTNAITMPLSLPFAFHFGSESRLAHMHQGRAAGASVRVLKQAGLASDLDTPDDLDLLNDPDALATLPVVGKRGLGRGAWTASSAVAAFVGDQTP